MSEGAARPLAGPLDDGRSRSPRRQTLGVPSKGAGIIDLDYLIDRLEELLDRATRIPYTSRVLLDEDEYLRLIDQMRISVPQEIKNARQIEAEREARLAAAQAQAEAIIAAANEKAEVLTGEHPVLEAANRRGDEVLAQAYEEANAIRGDADAYALEVLERLAAQLDQFGRTVHNGMALLRSGERVEIEPEIIGDQPLSPPPAAPDAAGAHGAESG